MSDYGNVAAPDVEAVTNAARIAKQVSSNLSDTVPSTWREIAFEHVLGGVLDDWVANGTPSLDAGDVDDLTNLMRLAVNTALAQDPSLREITFKTCLRRTMMDWVANWNAEEQ